MLASDLAGSTTQSLNSAPLNQALEAALAHIFGSDALIVTMFTLLVENFGSSSRSSDGC